MGGDLHCGAGLGIGLVVDVGQAPIGALVERITRVAPVIGRSGMHGIQAGRNGAGIVAINLGDCARIH